MKRKMCLGGLLLIASSAIISLAACSSFNLHKDNVIRNADTLVGKALLINNGFQKVVSSSDIELDATYAIAAVNEEKLLTSQYSSKVLASSDTSYDSLTINKKSDTEYSFKLSTDKYIDLTNRDLSVSDTEKFFTVEFYADYTMIKSSQANRGILYRDKYNFRNYDYGNANATGYSHIQLYKLPTNETKYTVSFETGVDGLTVNPQKISEGKYATAPDTLINGEQAVTGWHVKGDETETPVVV